MFRPQSLFPSTSQAGWELLQQWTLTLYQRPLLFLVLFLVLPLALVCGWLYVFNEHQWRAQEGKALLVSAQLASRTIEEELLHVRQFEEVLATQPMFLHAVKERDQASVRDSLQLLSALTPQVSRLLVTDPTGRVVVDLLASHNSTRAAAIPPVIESDPTPFLSSSATISPVYLYDEASGEKAVAVSTLLLDGARGVGMLHAQVRLGEIARWMEKIRIEPAGFLYVADTQGFLVSYPFQLLPGRPKNVSGWAPVRVSATEEGRVVRFYQGHPRLPWTAAVVTLKPFGWRIVAQQPDAAMLRPLYQLGSSLVGLIVILTLLISGAVLRWAHLHRVTLQLVAQQTRLLKSVEQQRLRAQLQRVKRSETESGHAP